MVVVMVESSGSKRSGLFGARRAGLLFERRESAAVLTVDVVGMASVEV